MAKAPESVYLLGCIYDADSPGPNYWSFDLQDCLTRFRTFAVATPYGAAWIEEIHPTKGALKILDYSPGMGLMRAEAYQTHTDRWQKKGYPQRAIELALAQWPEPLNYQLAFEQAQRESQGVGN